MTSSQLGPNIFLSTLLLDTLTFPPPQITSLNWFVGFVMDTEMFFCELETKTYVLLMEILGSKVYRDATTIVWLEGSRLCSQLILVLPFTC